MHGLVPGFVSALIKQCMLRKSPDQSFAGQNMKDQSCNRQLEKFLFISVVINWICDSEWLNLHANFAVDLTDMEN